MTESTKRVVMVATSSNVCIDEQWARYQALEAIADAVDVIGMAGSNDVSGLLKLRDSAVFYKALASAWEERFAELCNSDETSTILMEDKDG